MKIDRDGKIALELTKLEPDSLLNLYTLDTSTVVKDPFYDFNALEYNFHPYHIRPEDSNALLEEDKQKGVLIFNNIKYYYFPVNAEEFEKNGDGRLPRPIITFSNILPNIKDLTLNLGDLVGATFKRKRVFRKFLDNQKESDFSAIASEDVYIISRKKIENRILISFELVTIGEANNFQVPKRQLLRNHCPFRYRGDGCGYVRAKIIDSNDVEYGVADNYDGDKNLPTPVPWLENSEYEPGIVVYHTIAGIKYYFLCREKHTSSYVNRFYKNLWIADNCSKTLSGCRARWISKNSPNTVLPYGGYPCADRRIV